MSAEDPSERLARLTREALAREARQGGAMPAGRRSPRPGDLFTLRATAGLPVEWAVLERPPEQPGLLYAVPADTSPLAGTTDLAIPAGAPAGPLSLRLGHGAWLDEGLFEPDLHAGALGAEDLARAQSLRAALESGAGPTAALAREVDADPEYQDWIREVAARAREAVTSRPPERAPVRRVRAAPPRAAWALAAAFFAAMVGLSAWVASLSLRLERAEGPLLAEPVGDVSLGGGDVRGETDLEVSSGAVRVQVLLFIDPEAPPADAYQIEIRERTGKQVWKSPVLAAEPGAELSLVLSRGDLPDGIYHVLLHGISVGRTTRLDEQELRVVTAMAESEP